jgi:Transcriptional regulator, AbiEi antitoxin
VTDEPRPLAEFRQARAAEVAARQWGNITAAQLRAIGFSKDEVYEMARRGLLHRLHRGVYAFGALSPAPEQRWAAALLAAGEGSALSHTGAAAFYGQVAVREVTEVTAPTQRRGDERLKVHTAKRSDVVRKRGLVVTTPAQTLLDLAAASWPIDRMTHEMAAASIASLDDLRTLARNRRGEPGAAALARALDLPHTRSAWERRFLKWATNLEGVPAPVTNDRIGHLTVDCHWPDHHLVIELDTDQTHGAAWKRRDDAERDAWLQTRGIEVQRVRQDDWDPTSLAADLRPRLG